MRPTRLLDQWEEATRRHTVAAASERSVPARQPRIGRLAASLAYHCRRTFRTSRGWRAARRAVAAVQAIQAGAQGSRGERTARRSAP